MTEKRFKLHIEWYNKEKTDGEATLHENGQPLGVIESIEDARLIRNILNELYDENEELKKENKAFEHHLSELQGENEILTKENEQLKLDNDIKFWKQEYLRLSNHQQVIFHELAEAFKQGYKPSKEYQKMRNDEKERIEECKQKMERLRI